LRIGHCFTGKERAAHDNICDNHEEYDSHCRPDDLRNGRIRSTPRAHGELL